MGLTSSSQDNDLRMRMKIALSVIDVTMDVPNQLPQKVIPRHAVQQVTPLVFEMPAPNLDNLKVGIGYDRFVENLEIVDNG